MAFTAPLTPGNIVVLKVGPGTSGTGTLENKGTPVTLEEYTLTGTLVQSIAVPSSGALKLTSAGSATAEGQLSYGGGKIVFAGYDADVAAPTTGTLATTTNLSTDAAPVNRVVGVLGMDGTVNTSTRIVDLFSGNAPRAAAFDGTNLWIGGSGGAASTGGTYVATVGATTATKINGDITNIRSLNVYGGQLYMGCASGTTYHGVNAVGTGLPTSTVSLTNLLLTSGQTPARSPYDFIVSGTTMYVTDDAAAPAGGIYKYQFDGSAWVLQYQMTGGLSGVGFRSITQSGTTFIATGTNGQIYTFTDMGVSSTFSSIATVGTGFAFRGVEAIPGSVGASSISGTITLGDYSGIAPGSSTVPVTFRVLDNLNNVLQTTTLNVSTSSGVGSYNLTINSGISGAVKLAVDAPTWLVKTINTTVGATNANASVLNGESIKDGVIDLSDYDVIANSFNGLEDTDLGTPGNQPSPNWNVRGDLNRDGVVDLTDYTVVATNFNQLDN